MTEDRSKNVEFHGVVIPTQWDRHGNILQIAIQSDSFEKYLVDGEYSEELVRNIDQNIRISGTIIGEDLAGHKIISIHKINEWTSTK